MDTEVPELDTYERANVHRILAGHGEWFSARLLRFIKESAPDRRNLERLRLAFPDHVEAVRWWADHRADEGPYPSHLENKKEEE